MDVELLSKSANSLTSKIFSVISSSATKQNIVGDDTTPIYQLPLSACSEIYDLMHDEIQANLGKFQSLEEARSDVARSILGDNQLFNTATNIGTLTDPQLYTHTTLPISLSPLEQTNLYAAGGLPSDIIDKKSRAMCIDGVSFKSEDTKFWTNDKLQMLEERAFATGLNDVLADAICDSLVYGGSVLFPFYTDDTPSRILYKSHHLPNTIKRWVEVDRWNVVTVPSYIPTQEDYVNPKTIFITTSALEVNTKRCALIRPKPMPYWAVLMNLGWSPSDFTSWMRAYFGYAITMQSIPVMAQQSSLLLYKMPLDALQATVGAREVEKLMAINEQKMSEWSVTNPKAVNMIGDVEVVNRTYSGFEEFIGAMKSHLAAECGLPEPSLWHTPNKGFSDNTTESLLKQSEKLRLMQTNIERYLTNIRDILIADVFGEDSEEYSALKTLHITLNKPIVSTEKDMAETGARFAASVSSFVASGITPDTAVELSRPFFPSIKITDDMIASIKQSYKEQLESSSTLGGQSNNGAKIQAINTGKLTKEAK